MKQLFGQPARGHWRPPKPSKVILRGLAVSKGEDHRLTPTARVEVSLEHALETDPELVLEIGPGPIREANLGIVLGPTVKAIFVVTYKVYVPGPQMNLCPGRE